MQMIKNLFSNKKIRIFIILVAVVLISAYYMRGCSEGLSIVYKYNKIDRGVVKKTVSVSGVLALEKFEVVRSLIAGEIIALNADFNSNVKKGQLLARIYSETLDDTIASYSETFQRAKIELETKKDFYLSKKNLLEEDLISKNDYKSALRAYKVALSNYKQVKLTYSKYMEQKKAKFVTAPVSGTIIDKWAEIRQKVKVGASLFKIAQNLKRMKLIISVDEADIGLVKEKQEVEFTVSAYPKKVFRGKIKQVRMNPINKGGIVAYESLVICENPELLLKPGMSVTATIKVNRKENVLRIPKQALAVSPVDIELKGGQNIVWIKNGMGNLEVRKVDVKIGLDGDEYVEVVAKKGKKNYLSAGDNVLVGIHKKLEAEDTINKYK